MEVDVQKLLGVVLFCVLSVVEVTAKKDRALYCGACLGMVEEMNTAIARVDKKKTIQIGSFRIDAQGNQDLREVPYARSDVHLTEEFETLCNKMYSYGLASRKDKKNRDIYIRKYAVDGTMVSKDSANFDETITKKLKYACEQILEDFEDELMKLFKNHSADIEKTICVAQLGFCKETQVSERMWAQAEAVMAGMKEKTDEERERNEAKLPDSEGENEGENEGETVNQEQNAEVQFPEPTEADLAQTEEATEADLAQTEDAIVMTDGEIPDNENKDEL